MSDPTDGDAADQGGRDGETKPVSAAENGSETVGEPSRLYRTFPTIFVARRNLSRNKLRSLLAMLGIVIGVIAIAALGVFGSTLQTAFLSSFSDVGNRVIVSPAFEEGVTEIDADQVRQIERAAGDAAVVPLSSDRALVKTGRQQTSTTVYRGEGIRSVFRAESGRIPTRLRADAVVGSALAERLGIEPGNSISVGGQTYRVVAVLRRQGGFDPLGADQAVFLPSKPGVDSYDSVVVEANSGQAANASAVAIREELNGRSKVVSVTELRQIVEQITSFFDVLNAFLVGIGSISLIVAGVSILNVMLMSTVERKEEIGVFRAVGVHKRDVMKTILVEAGLLGIGGGLIGVTLSIAAGGVVGIVVLDDLATIVSVRNGLFILAAFCFGVLASVLSGLYPAWKAANQHPVDALRD